MSELEDIWHEQPTARGIMAMKREIDRLRENCTRLTEQSDRWQEAIDYLQRAVDGEADNLWMQEVRSFLNADRRRPR